MKKKDAEDKIVVATHHKAGFLFEILETYEAGLHLLGSEVKSLRGGKSSLDGCFGREDKGELYLVNFYIPLYPYAHISPPDPRRNRKLLLRKTEINRILGKLKLKNLTLVPLEIYFRRGWAKAALGLARGKTGVDRREDIKKRTLQREAEKSFKGKFRA